MSRLWLIRSPSVPTPDKRGISNDAGSLLIFRSVSVRPTHLFDPGFRP
jgi:hypothetical protein